MTYEETVLVWIHGGIAFGLAFALGLVVTVNLGDYLINLPASIRRKRYQRERETEAQRDARWFDAIVAEGIVSYDKPIRIYPAMGLDKRKWVAALADGAYSAEMPDECELLVHVVEVAHRRAERARAARTTAESGAK